MHINISKVTFKRTERVSMTSKKTGVTNRMWKKKKEKKEKENKEGNKNEQEGRRKKE